MAKKKKAKKQKQRLNFDPTYINAQLMPLAKEIEHKLNFLKETFGVELEEFPFPELTMDEIVDGQEK